MQEPATRENPEKQERQIWADPQYQQEVAGTPKEHGQLVWFVVDVKVAVWGQN